MFTCMATWVAVYIQSVILWSRSATKMTVMALLWPVWPSYACGPGLKHVFWFIVPYKVSSSSLNINHWYVSQFAPMIWSPDPLVVRRVQIWRLSLILLNKWRLCPNIYTYNFKTYIYIFLRSLSWKVQKVYCVSGCGGKKERSDVSVWDPRKMAVCLRIASYVKHCRWFNLWIAKQ